MKNRFSAFLTLPRAVHIALLFLFHVLLFAAADFFGPIHWQANDDVEMAWIASGGYGTPDCHLVFINALLGYVLSRLYMLTTALEWYTLYQVLLHLLSATTIVYLILTSAKSPYLKSAFLLLFYPSWLSIVLALQFTTTAGLTATAGCMLLLRLLHSYSLSDPTSNPNPAPKETTQTHPQPTPTHASSPLTLAILGGALLVLASLLRFNAACLAILVFVPLFLSRLRLHYRRYIPFALIAALILGLHFADRLFYTSPDWQYYTAYNQARSHFQDASDNWMTEDQLPDGITLDDVALARSYCSNPDVVTLDVLHRLNQQIDSNVSPFKRFKRGIKALFLDFPVYTLALLLLALLAFAATPSWRTRAFIALYILFIAAVLAFVGMYLDFKSRAFFCFWFAQMLAVFYCIPSATPSRTFRLLSFTALPLSVLLFAFMAVRDIYQSCAKYDNGTTPFPERYLAAKSVPDGSFLILLGGYKQHEVPPFHMSDYLLPTYQMSWAATMPLNTRAASYRDFANDNCYFFVWQSELHDPYFSIDHFRRVLLHHYHLPTSIHLHAQQGDWCIVQLRPAPPTTETTDTPTTEQITTTEHPTK